MEEGELESPKDEAVPGEHLPGCSSKPPCKKKPGGGGKKVVYLPGIDEQHFSDTVLRSNIHTRQAHRKVRIVFRIVAGPLALCR